MATITNAGVGSGLDLEAIISATLQVTPDGKFAVFTRSYI